MNMAVNVYEYGRGGKCVYMFKYTYAGIRIIMMQIKKGIYVYIFVGFKVGLGISRTNADSQWNPVYNAFHQNFCCGNETIRR